MSELYCSGAGQPIATFMGIWGRPSDPVKRIVSQNVRGLRDEYADKQEALVEWAKTKHVYIACLQEVWRTGTKVQNNVHVHGMPTGWALITHGLQTADARGDPRELASS